MFSIKRLFYLNTSVIIQFFKTFLLPYFDYCLSLYIFFPKFAIQRICNIYTICLYKLFKFKLEHKNLLDEAFLVDELESNIEEQEEKLTQKKKEDLSERIDQFNSHLAGYNLESFPMRIFKKLMVFGYTILNNSKAPINLKSEIKIKPPETAPEQKPPDQIPTTVRGKRYLEILAKRDMAQVLSKTNKFEEQTFSFFFSKLINNFSSYFSIRKLSKFLSEFSLNNLNNIKTFNSIFSKFNLSYQSFSYKKKKIPRKKQ